MAVMVCDLCGGKLIMRSGGVAICDSCGMEHSADRMREKVQEIKGTVQIDNAHMVGNYLEMAQTARDAGNNAEAESYCNKVIEIDPGNYRAWMLKGESAAWQSTLQNLRIDEGVTDFVKGINNAPENERANLLETAKEQIKKLSVALISLRADRFSKWPDAEETAGFISDLAAIMGAVIAFVSQTGSGIPLPEIMEPVADQINHGVVNAYQNVILPEYKSERYPWPDDDDFRKYIERLGYCEKLVEKSIDLCGETGEGSISRYKNLIFLHKAAITSCSYDSQYADLSEQWRVNIYAKKPGLHPVRSENRVYFKKASLSEVAVAARRELISKYEAKIKEIEAASDH